MNRTSLTFLSTLILSANAFAETSISVSPFSMLNSLEFALDSSNGNSVLGDPTSELSFTDVALTGVSFQFSNTEKSSFNIYTLNLGTGNNDGTLIDKDWYSESYAKEQGRDTLFSSTHSDVSAKLFIEFSQEFGEYQSNVFGLGESTKLGFKNSVSYLKMNAYGLTPLIDSYGKYDTGNASYSYDKKVIGIQTFTYEMALTSGIKKVFENGLFLEFNAELIPYASIYTLDYHFLRQDLKLPSITISSVNYGIGGELKAGYQIDDYEISFSASKKELRSYSFGVIEFDTVESGKGQSGFVSQTKGETKLAISLKKTF